MNFADLVNLRGTRLLFAMALFFISANAFALAQIHVDVSRIGDATHLEFSGVSEWKYDLKRDAQHPNQVILRLPHLSAEALSKLRGHNDQLISKLLINEKGIDDSTEVAFTVSDRSDFFDYISDQPSRLIVDFFPKDPTPLAPAVPKTTPQPPKKSAETKTAALPEKKPQADLAATDGEDDDDDEADAVAAVGHALPTKKNPRAPAGSDLVLVAKSELPEAPSLAEQISSKKDFNHGIFDGGDPEFRRFSIRDYEIKEDAVIASRANFYLPFPMLELGVPQLKAMLDVAPTYEIKAGESRENKEARILLELFSSQKRALFLKAAAEFLETYPSSSYDEIIRYMVADAHYDIWRASNSSADFESAMNDYLGLSEKYPESPMAPRTLLLMGYSYLDRGDSFGALKSFQRFTRQFPKSKHLDRVNISIAESYLRLNRFDDAYALLDQVEKTAKSKAAAEEAAYRKGDVFFRKKDYAEAINQYKGALARHPAVAGLYGNAWYNTAEAQFDLHKYRDALESYRLFLQKFPDHEQGGYAMTRMGELLGILGADQRRAQGAFLESYFRYRATPGAGVARIRLLTSRLPEMKDKEIASALQEVEDITAKYMNRPKTKKEIEKDEKAAKTLAEEESAAKAPKKAGGEGHEGGGEGGEGKAPKVAKAEPEEKPAADIGAGLIPIKGEDPTRRKPELPGIEEFSALLISDGENARHDYDTAASELIAFYQKNPQSPNKEKFKTRIVRNLSDGVAAAVDRGDFIDALRRYSKNADGWLKNSDRVDVRYNVGKAYEQAGVFKEAGAVYQECLKKLAAIKAGHEEHEHQIFENLPKVDSVQLRLAAVAAKEKDFARAEGNLKKIVASSALSESEQVERAEVSADVAEARGQTEAARKYLNELIKDWNGDAQATSPLHLRIARLEFAKKDYKAADVHLAQILNWKKEEGARVSEDVHAQALELRGDLMVARGKRTEAVKVYRELLQDYESTRPLASVRYRLGQMLYQDGNLKGAETVWNELKSGKDGLWQHLAAEQMQGAKWQKEYKKYIDRIPAAANLK